MNFPGNILGLALSVIPGQSVTLYKATGRTTNAIGNDVASYAPGVPLAGSMQPVDAKLVQTLGLDMDKRYATFYGTADIVTPIRDSSGDQLAFSGRRYQVVGDADWLTQAGFRAVLCVEVGPDA